MNRPHISWLLKRKVLILSAFLTLFHLHTASAASYSCTLDSLVTNRFNVGDVITLPEFDSTGDYYFSRNTRVARVNGRTLTALEPGGTPIQLWGEGGFSMTNSGAMIVVPEAIGSGKVYIFKEGSTTWNNAANWECVTGGGTYPQNTDDVAMVLYTNSTTAIDLIIGDAAVPTNTVGELYVGCLKNVATSIRLQGYNGTAASLNFARSTTDPALLRITGDSYGFTLDLGDNAETYRLNINTLSDVHLDAGYCGDPTNRLSFPTNHLHTLGWGYVSINISEGRYFRIINAHPTGSANCGTYCALWSNTRLLGKGIFWHDSMYNVRMDADTSNFAGLMRDTGFGHAYYDRSANIQTYSIPGTNFILEIAGFVSANVSESSSAGFFATGINHFYNSPSSNPGNRVPPAGVLIRGGTLVLRPEESRTWEGPITNWTASLTVGRGLGRLYVGSSGTLGVNPMNTFSTDAILHENRGTLIIQDANVINNSSSMNAQTKIGGFQSVSIGGTGNPASTETYPIIPWAVMKTTSDSDIMFASVDPTTKITYRPIRNSIALDSVADPLQNVYANGSSISLSASMTINSLWLNNASADKNLGNHTLTITSGGLILNGNGTMIGTQGGGNMNGRLVFGNTAYVYPTSTSLTSPQEIWAPIVASNGFVCSYYGYLVLGGDQTGIDDEIVINNGKLILGNTNGTAKAVIDVNVRIAGGNSVLQVGSIGTLHDVDVIFDDVYNFVGNMARFGGKIVIPAGQLEHCNKFYINDLSRPVRRGVSYGATGSGADVIDDAHFSGTGRLIARHDDTDGTLMVIR